MMYTASWCTSWCASSWRARTHARRCTAFELLLQDTNSRNKEIRKQSRLQPLLVQDTAVQYGRTGTNYSYTRSLMDKVEKKKFYVKKNTSSFVEGFRTLLFDDISGFHYHPFLSGDSSWHLSVCFRGILNSARLARADITLLSSTNLRKKTFK